MRLSEMFLASLVVLAGCTTPSQRQEALQKDIAKQVGTVCALPPAKRQAALERIDREYGLVLQCAEDGLPRK